MTATSEFNLHTSTLADERQSLARDFWDGLRKAYLQWRARRVMRHEVAALNGMSDRMLRDIGLYRSEIGHAVVFGRTGN